MLITPALFIDTNIPIYAAGREHRYKRSCQRVIMLAAQRPLDFVTSSAVLQEIIHYYLATQRWSEGRGIFRDFVTTMNGRIEPVHPDDAALAAQLADQGLGVNAQDLVHAAVMRRLGVDRIITADKDFDRIDGIERLDPINLDKWKQPISYEM